VAPRSLLLAGRLVRGGAHVAGWLEVRDERLGAVELGVPPRGAQRHDGLIAPGLCDVQVNGGAGVNVTDGAGALDRIDRLQLEHGVTSYLPTIISTDEEEASAAVAEISERAADPASPVEGVHLEGPFLNPRFRGVHRAEHLAVPSEGEPPYYRSSAVRLVTLAPELDGALELISSLRRRGVAVSIGHTGASAEEAEQAAAHGAAGVTHLFNAMKELRHRSPGVVGWSLAAGRLRLGVIADGFHVDPVALRLVDRVARGRVVLVSDASPAAGAPDGTFRMAGIEIHSAGGCVHDEHGILAGSRLTLDEAVRRWAGFTGCPLATALTAASERPARLAGIASGLRAGAPANLVLVDDAGNVERVMRRGEWLR
jgi:N-acetylglucosamine-6-phosphate deacetylase